MAVHQETREEFRARVRRETAEQIAAAIEGSLIDLDQYPGEEYRECAQIAREFGAKP